MELSVVVELATLIPFAIFIISFIFWWSFLCQETHDLDLDVDKDCIDPLQVLPIFIAINLHRVYLLSKECQFFINEVSFLKDIGKQALMKSIKRFKLGRNLG